MPLSRGNLVVHGDVPRRSDRLNSADNESTDACEPIFHEDELPPPAMTRNLLSMFRSMEDPSMAPPTPEAMKKKQAASRSGVYRSPSMGASGLAAGDHLNRSDAEYAADSGEFENDPVYNADVVRESDHTDYAEMPEHGMTRGLLARFQNRE